MAGLIALVQTDIKRVIAYSTMSQIGYMFVGAGLGAYPNAMFHLMTHAFFKALLFLAAGIAIHAVAGEQDIRKLAGIGKLMPHTKVVFLIGSLALVGIPPFAGFFSKDSIIAAALDRGWYGDVLFAAGIVGAFLTGLYAFRLFFIVFTGEPTAFAREHFHAAARPGGTALDALDGRRARGALVRRRALAVRARLASALDLARPGRRAARRADEHAGVTSRPSWRSRVGLAGIVVAWAIYGAKRVQAPRAVKLFERKFYWDELYDVVLYRTGDLVARGLLRRRRAAADRRLDQRGHGRRRARLARALPRADRARPLVRARARERARHPRRRLPGGPLMSELADDDPDPAAARPARSSSRSRR